MTTPATILMRSWNIVRNGAYIPTEFYVCDTREFVYISIPKVACTAIKSALFPISDKCGNADHEDYMSIHHDAACFQRHRINRKQRKFFSFSFVRNPFDRLVSCYLDKVVKPEQHHGFYYFDTGYNRNVIRRFGGRAITPDMSFEDFVTTVVKVPDWLADAHFRSQTAMLYRKNRLLVDYVGKFENIAADWMRLQSRFDLPVLGVKNPTMNRNITDFYGSYGIINEVIDRYSADFQHFGYATDIGLHNPGG